MSTQPAKCGLCALKDMYFFKLNEKSYRIIDRFGNGILLDKHEIKELEDLLCKESSVKLITLPPNPPECEQCESCNLNEIGEAPGIAVLLKCKECGHEFYL